MRLAIVNLTSGGFSGGQEKYLKHMLPRLAEHNDVDDLLCISPEGIDIRAWFKNQPQMNFGFCNTFTLSHLVHIPDRKMAKYLDKFSPDLVFLPVAWHIRFNSVPVVNMVRNMEPYLSNFMGDPPRAILKKFIQRKHADSSVRRADHTIAVSGFVKDYLVTRLSIPEDKVSKIYHGLTPPTHERRTRPGSVPIAWGAGFLFTLGSVIPYRGLEDALKALSYLKSRNVNMRLVIAGETLPGMKNYRASLEQLIEHEGLTNNICWAGKLNEAEMRWCYDKCSLFIMTTRIEACPNIALEAMSNGAISIVADNPPLPEVFSDCAAYYEPGNGRLLAERILNLLACDDGERRIISTKARKRSAMFSWDLTADKTMNVLMRTLKQSKRQKVHSS